jgi:hypothetical protein
MIGAPQDMLFGTVKTDGMGPGGSDAGPTDQQSLS